MGIPSLPTASNSLPPSTMCVVFTLSRDTEVTLPYERYYQSCGVSRGEFSTSLKAIAFLDIALFSIIEVDRRFRGAYCLNYDIPDDGDSTRFFHSFVEVYRRFRSAYSLHH
jgi:hypothetical protein